MSLTITESSKSSFPPIEPGTYVAYCYGMVDLGLQHSKTYNKDSYKLLLMFELPTETVEIDGEPKARIISGTYTASLSAKSNLRKLLESWRGAPFTVEELKGFDLKKLVGVPCLITLTSETREDKTHTNISGIAKMMKGMVPPAPTMAPITYEIETDHPDKILDLPEWVQTRIRESVTYQERLAGMGEGALPEGNFTPADRAVDVSFSEATEAADDDLPF